MKINLPFMILIFTGLFFTNNLFSQGVHAREESKLNEALQQYPLDGEGIVIAMIDRGLDYFHPDFRDENGNTRLLYYYDMINQEGANDPGNPYGVGTIFTEEELNNSLQSNTVLSTDRYGHGTATTGIECGNGSAVLSEDFKGVAPKARIIVVKAVQDYFPPFNGQPGQDPFFSADYVMIALQFVRDKLDELDMQGVALMNIGSVGGPTDGTSEMNQAMDQFVDAGYPLVCGVGDDGGNDNHASANVGMGETVELQIQKSETGNLRFDLWYSENDRFEISIIRPDNTTEGPFAAPATANSADDHFLSEINYYHRGANVEFFGATSNRRELLIDFKGATGTYKLQITGTSIGDDGLFHATLNPSRHANNNRFLNYAVSGYNINDYSAAFKVISPGDYVVKNDWIDTGGNSQQITGQGDPGEIWVGSSAGPTNDERLGTDFVACGEVLYGAYSPDTWYSQYPHLLVQGGEGHYGIQNAVSAAAPLTTGVIALMLQMNPNLTPQQVKEILQMTARSDEFTGTVPNAQWGYGKLDVHEALKEVEKTLGVTSFSSQSRFVKIMPNPVQNTLSISLEEQTGFDFGGMRIFDVFGKEVYSIGNLEIKSAIDVSGLAPGVYFVKIEGENQSATSKFVKQ